MDTILSTERAMDEYAASNLRKGKLRLKPRHRQSRRNDREPSSRRHRSRSASPSRPRKKPKKPSVMETDDPSLYDDVYLPGINGFKYKDPEAAFQESMFEAMADDEGAAYWEGVYGQPVHVYERPKVENEKGELESMTDEEYTTYVRRKMYEKTDEFLEQEKRRRQREREKEKRVEEEERLEWQGRERERLLREKERRQRKHTDRFKKSWIVYTQAWEDILITNRSKDVSSGMPWPVESGRLSDVTKDNIENFLLSGSNVEGMTAGAQDKRSYTDLLRLERVRWHPDKVLQRVGRETITDEVLHGVTAVFQIIDSLWAGQREKRVS